MLRTEANHWRWWRIILKVLQVTCHAYNTLIVMPQHPSQLTLTVEGKHKLPVIHNSHFISLGKLIPWWVLLTVPSGYLQCAPSSHMMTTTPVQAATVYRLDFCSISLLASWQILQLLSWPSPTYSYRSWGHLHTHTHTPQCGFAFGSPFSTGFPSPWEKRQQPSLLLQRSFTVQAPADALTSAPTLCPLTPAPLCSSLLSSSCAEVQLPLFSQAGMLLPWYTHDFLLPCL